MTQAGRTTGGLTVGELAARTGCTPEAIRYYEREGVVRRRQSLQCRWCAARSTLPQAPVTTLHGWTDHASKRTEHAAVAGIRSKERVATRALVKELTGVGRHREFFGMTTLRAGQERLKVHERWLEKAYRPAADGVGYPLSSAKHSQENHCMTGGLHAAPDTGDSRTSCWWSVCDNPASRRHAPAHPCTQAQIEPTSPSHASSSRASR